MKNQTKTSYQFNRFLGHDFKVIKKGFGITSIVSSEDKAERTADFLQCPQGQPTRCLLKQSLGAQGLWFLCFFFFFSLSRLKRAAGNLEVIKN